MNILVLSALKVAISAICLLQSAYCPAICLLQSAPPSCPLLTARCLLPPTARCSPNFRPKLSGIFMVVPAGVAEW